jgi:hypothetical protein
LVGFASILNYKIGFLLLSVSNTLKITIVKLKIFYELGETKLKNGSIVIGQKGKMFFK